MKDNRVQELREQGFSLKESIEQFSNEQKIYAQELYCKENNTMMFAPNSTKSWCCNKNIWERIGLKKAMSELITGCPHCNRSFVE